MKTLVLAPVFPPATEGGGPIRSLGALVHAAPDDVEIRVVTAANEYTSRRPLAVDADRWTPRGAAQVWYASQRRGRAPLSALRSARRWRPDVVYVNGFFEPSFSVLPQVLDAVGFWRGARRLVAPRGEFGPGALARHPLRKRAFIRLYRTLRLHRSVIWHASSAAEEADIRALWGPTARVLVRENETSLPLRAVAPRAGKAAPLRAAFIARIVAHKGLDVVLEALSRVPADRPVELAVHGPVEDPRYLRECFRIIDRLPPHITVAVGAELPAAEVLTTLAGSDVLLFPTSGENFGHVVAEALSVSCPVIATPWTPWTPTLRAGGGVVVADRSVTSWHGALADYAATTPAERHRRRVAAGEAYDRWRAQSKGPHVLDLLRAAIDGD
jgi:glycosyltransferase involved in cell wall biosynthesis